MQLKTSVHDLSWRMLQTRLFRNIRFRTHQTSVYHLLGKTRRSGADLSIVTATSQKRANLISKIAFSGEVEPRFVCKTRFHDFDSILEKLEPDIAFAYDNSLYAEFLRSKNFFIMPNIDFNLDISNSWESIIQKMCRTKRKMMRQIEKLGYEYELTKDPEKLKTFYYDMYKPHLIEKYGKCAGPTSFDIAKKHFLKGGLLFTRRNGHYVSGAIYRIIDNKLFVPLLSFRDSHDSSSQTAGLALLHFLILVGKGKACTRIDYEGSFPSFKYGLFNYKKTCGMDMTPQKGWDTDIVAARFHNFDGGVRDFIADVPFVFDDGELKGLTFVDFKENLQSTYNVPGLSSLIVLSPHNNSHELEEQGAVLLPTKQNQDPSIRYLLGLASIEKYMAYNLDFNHKTHFQNKQLELAIKTEVSNKYYPIPE